LADFFGPTGLNVMFVISFACIINAHNLRA